MHGTWVNGEKVRAGEDAIVKNGDEVVFGTEVVRGHGESVVQVEFREIPDLVPKRLFLHSKFAVSTSG